MVGGVSRVCDLVAAGAAKGSGASAGCAWLVCPGSAGGACRAWGAWWPVRVGRQQGQPWQPPCSGLRWNWWVLKLALPGSPRARRAAARDTRRLAATVSTQLTNASPGNGAGTTPSRRTGSSSARARPSPPLFPGRALREGARRFLPLAGQPRHTEVRMPRLGQQQAPYGVPRRPALACTGSGGRAGVQNQPLGLDPLPEQIVVLSPRRCFHGGARRGTSGTAR